MSKYAKGTDSNCLKLSNDKTAQKLEGWPHITAYTVSKLRCIAQIKQKQTN